jgi:GDP-mannose 6-dehydrogenase
MGLDVLVYDPEVHLSRLLGANRRFIEQHVPHIGKLMREDLAQVIRDSEVLVVGLAQQAIQDALARGARPDQLVIDLVRLPNRDAIPARVEGLCW